MLMAEQIGALLQDLNDTARRRSEQRRMSGMWFWIDGFWVAVTEVTWGIRLAEYRLGLSKVISIEEECEYYADDGENAL